MLLLRKKKNTVRHISKIFSEKLNDFMNEPVVQCDVPVVKNTFIDDVDISMVTKKIDWNT